MIIEEQQFVKLCKLYISKYFQHPNIIIKDIDFKVTDVLKVYANVLYCNMESELSLLTTIEIMNNTIVLEPKGIVKYGFIQLDLIKLLEDFFLNNAMIHIRNNKVYIDNNYIKSISLSNEKIELSLK